jgi:hypothetical protein
MSFQAPYDIVDMQRLQVQQAQQEEQMKQQYQAQIIGALGDLAGMYQQHEQMKAGVKSGEQMLKMFGPQLGVDSKILSSPEYKAMGLQGQSALHSNIWGSLGAISQLRMAGMRDSTQRAGQDLAAVLPDLRNRSDANSLVAGGEGTVMLPPAPEGAYTPTMTPSPDAMSAAGAWYNQSRQTPVSISGGAMRPFYRSVR